MNWVPFLYVLVAVIVSIVWMGLALGAVLTKMGMESSRAWVPVLRWVAAAEAGRTSRVAVLIARSLSALGVTVLLIGLAMRGVQGEELAPIFAWMTLAGVGMFWLGAFAGWIFWIIGAGTIGMRLNLSSGWVILAALSPNLWAAIVGWAKIGTPIPSDAIGKAASAAASRHALGDAPEPAAAPKGSASVFGAGLPAAGPALQGLDTKPFESRAFVDRPVRATEVPARAASAPAPVPEAVASESESADSPAQPEPTLRASQFVAEAAEDVESHGVPNDVSVDEFADVLPEAVAAAQPAQPTLDRPVFDDTPPAASARPVSPYISAASLPVVGEPADPMPYEPELNVPHESFVVPELEADDAYGEHVKPPAELRARIPDEPRSLDSPLSESAAASLSMLPPGWARTAAGVAEPEPGRPTATESAPPLVTPPTVEPEPANAPPTISAMPPSPAGQHEDMDDLERTQVPTEGDEDASPAVATPFAVSPYGTPVEQSHQFPPVTESTPTPSAPPPTAIPPAPQVTESAPAVEAPAAFTPLAATPPPTRPAPAGVWAAPGAAAAVDVSLAGENGNANDNGGDLDDADDHTVIAQRRRDVWVLHVDGGDSYPLTAEEVSIGRAAAGAQEGSHVGVDDATRTMSKRHAKLRLVDGTWRVSDLGSTNGTFVRGVDGREVEVAPGSEVALDGTLLLGDLEAHVVNQGSGRV